jgi:hypothetical protein
VNRIGDDDSSTPLDVRALVELLYGRRATDGKSPSSVCDLDRAVTCERGISAAVSIVRHITAGVAMVEAALFGEDPKDLSKESCFSCWPYLWLW